MIFKKDKKNVFALERSYKILHKSLRQVKCAIQMLTIISIII